MRYRSKEGGEIFRFSPYPKSHQNPYVWVLNKIVSTKLSGLCILSSTIERNQKGRLSPLVKNILRLFLTVNENENGKVFCFQLLVQNPPNRKTKMKLKRKCFSSGFRTEGAQNGTSSTTTPAVGDVHQLHLDTEEICILYNGLVVTQMAAGRRCVGTLLSSCDPVFEVLVCYHALDVTFVL